MRIKLYILSLVMLLAVSTSCTNEVDNSSGIRIPEGKPAVLKLNLNRVSSDVTTKGMTNNEEKELHNIYFIIFNSTGNLSIKIKYTDMDNDFIFPVISGNDMDIYAIANYDRFESQLDTITSKTWIDNLRPNLTSMSSGTSSFSNPGYLTYTAVVEDVDIVSGTTISSPQSVSIQLSCISAKITIRVEDNTTNQGVSLLSWKLYNTPATTFLFGSSTDAMSGSSDYYSPETEFSWEKVETLSGITAGGQSFYMWENRKGTSSSTEFKTKMEYAPSNASYVVIDMIIASNDTTYNSQCTLYLGANDINDYNIRRGTHYTWTVDIQGVNSFTAGVTSDDNVTTESFPVFISVSSIMTMDAHPSQRNFQIKGDLDLINNVSVEIVDKDKKHYSDAGFNAEWLKLSPVELDRAQVRQAADTIFQQSGTTGYFVRGRYIPHKSVRNSGDVDISWITAHGISFSASGTGDGTGGNLILPEDDDCLPLSQATYRMCYKITDIPFTSAGNSNMISIYSDEYEYIDGQIMRSAYLRVNFHDIAQNSDRYIDYRITQHQSMYVGRVVDTYSHSSATDSTAHQIETRTTLKDIVIEQIEESAVRLHPDLAASVQYRNSMQWGYKDYLLYNPSNDNNDKYDKYRNGYFLTANSVYGDGTTTWSSGGNVTKDSDGGNVSWSDGNAYRTKYGRGSSITEAYTGTTSSSPYYIASSTASAVYDPVYNSSAARYCHEKNRDINGDGIISPSEAHWYLPSQQEICQIFISLEAIRNSTSEYGYGYYWSSSEESATNSFIMGFMSGYSKETQLKNKYTATSGTDNNNFSVRCIRNK